MKKYSLIMMLMGLPLTGVSFASFFARPQMEDADEIQLENFDEMQPVDISEDDINDQYERGKTHKHGIAPIFTWESPVITGGGEKEMDSKTLGEIEQQLLNPDANGEYYNKFRLVRKAGNRGMRRPGESKGARQLRRDFNIKLDTLREEFGERGDAIAEDFKDKKRERDEALMQKDEAYRQYQEALKRYKESEENFKNVCNVLNTYRTDARREKQNLTTLKSSIDEEEAARQAYIAKQNK